MSTCFFSETNKFFSHYSATPPQPFSTHFTHPESSTQVPLFLLKCSQIFKKFSLLWTYNLKTNFTCGKTHKIWLSQSFLAIQFSGPKCVLLCIHHHHLQSSLHPGELQLSAWNSDSSFLTPSSQLPAATIPLSVCMILTILSVSYKWNHNIGLFVSDLLYLVIMSSKLIRVVVWMNMPLFTVNLYIPHFA